MGQNDSNAKDVDLFAMVNATVNGITEGQTWERISQETPCPWNEVVIYRIDAGMVVYRQAMYGSAYLKSLSHEEFTGQYTLRK